jgi:hypothetical protein
MGTPYKKKWLAVIPPAKIIKICGVGLSTAVGTRIVDRRWKWQHE